MSSNLMWRPVSTEANDLPKDLKFVISRRLWDTDGSCGHGEASMTVSDLPYLEGVRDSGIKGAQELITAIKKHGVVILWHEY